MSHTTTLKTIKIVDIEALEDAVSFLAKEGVRVSFHKNTRPRMYYERQQVMCDYVVKIAGCPYDVGFEKQADGSYAPIFDAWDGHIRQAIGAASGILGASVEEETMLNISRLVDLYGVHAARNQLSKDGYGYGAEIYRCAEDNSYVLEVGAAY